MSQDNQNSQPPSSPEPRADQVTQPPQQPYQRVLPFWKNQIIQILRGTIRLLETTVVKLETAPPPGTKETPSFFQPLQSLWSAALAKIRFVLPDSLSAKLSDTVLTGVIAVIVVILVWTNLSTFTKKPPETENVPPQQAETPLTITTPTATVPPEAPPSVTETPPPSEEIVPPPVAETPPPSPEPEPIPTPTPTPTVILTPEQSLIAAIENQVAEISDRFASGLIQSIQANFRTSDLTIKISDAWFNLQQSQQDKLCDLMLQRSQELDFSHLEIVDSQNRLVARNPVVGTDMVIFQRQSLTVPSPQFSSPEY
ncbi:MAG: hypothetical protein DSM106950_00960 [Stigonema ocellatum SAG 48.90 = DSM 106950]|nr:hypothetical protein [Stigonema ocellatum SAG 48.90 = DSM 106950]